MQKEWTKKEIEFVLNNHPKMSIREMSEKLGRSESSVENKRCKLGLKNERKYYYNTSFFKQPLNEVSAYWFGFLYADGFVVGKELGIVLGEKDIDHLKKFNKDIKGNIPISLTKKPAGYIKEKPVKERITCEMRIYCKEIVSDLYALGLTEKKSLTCCFPTFDDEYILWCFIRGYFDGDGSVYYDKRSNQLRCKITSGSSDFKKGFANFLNACGIKTYMSGIFDCGITGKESTRIFLSNIYQNANIYLDRKYKKYQNYKYLFGFNK
jgi:hypothetical protein